MAHRPVLLSEVIKMLDLRSGQIFLDGTVGSGGHAQKICEQYGKGIRIVAIDQDEDSIGRAKETLSSCNVDFYTKNFEEFDEVLKTLGIEKVHAMLFDLGWSSDQFEGSGRGFSFQQNEPLVMTYTKSPGKEKTTAHDIINHWEEQNIATILRGYGEERFAGRIARVIVEARNTKAIETTRELAEIITRAVPKRFQEGRLHPETKTFQALRIAANDELETLKRTLPKTLDHLEVGGRVAVITFHSLEDRIVKRWMKDEHGKGRGKIVTKKPIVASDKELQENPRARSAKLRIIQKI